MVFTKEFLLKQTTFTIVVTYVREDFKKQDPTGLLDPKTILK